MQEVRARQLIGIERTQTALEAMHKAVEENISKGRQRQRQKHNEKTNIAQINFQVGDFVMIRNIASKERNLATKWVGPWKMLNVISSHVFEVSDLIEGKTELAHARRLILYKQKRDGDASMDDILEYAEHSEPSYKIAESIRDISESESGIVVQFQSQGLPDVHD